MSYIFYPHLDKFMIVFKLFLVFQVSSASLDFILFYVMTMMKLYMPDIDTQFELNVIQIFTIIIHISRTKQSAIR